ncbi:MAG: hypothetical protein PVF76_07330 [Syntrophobacterales bacterium]|jgi:hypothetical protein
MAKRASIFLSFAVIVIGAIVAVVIWKWDAVVDKISEKRLEVERQAWIQRTQELEGMIVDLQKGEVEPKPLLPAERLTQVFGPTSPLVKAASPASMNCRELEESLRAFCNYLDATETLRSQKAYRDCWTLLNDIFAILEKSPPTISGEAYRPSIIIQNSFFFFRSLRKERINIVREVLKYEADLAEPLMGSLYHWLMKGRKCNKSPSSPANLDVLYQYAGFFLNTLGGHSYLYRRDSRIRLLTIYYAILAVHEANLQGLNELGLDLRFFLPLIFHEIQSRNDLLYAEEYLQKLSNLQLHYFRQE